MFGLFTFSVWINLDFTYKRLSGLIQQLGAFQRSLLYSARMLVSWVDSSPIRLCTHAHTQRSFRTSYSSASITSTDLHTFYQVLCIAQPSSTSFGPDTHSAMLVSRSRSTLHAPSFALVETLL